MQIESWGIDRIKPYHQNPRVNDSAVEKTAVSIQEYGWQQPIVVDSDGVVVVGHTRLKAAKKLGLKEAPVLVADNLTPAQIKAYRIADNKTGELADWDMDLLNTEIQELADMDFDIELTGFDADDFDFLDGPGDGGGLTDDDAVPEVPEEPVCKLGDLWILGDHRVLCGDSTDRGQVERLMDGQKADMVFTDPPYNTGMTAKIQSSESGGTLWKGKTKNKGGSARLSHMFNDSYTDSEWQVFMASFCSTYYDQMKDNTGAYICLDWRRNHELVPHIKDHFKLSNIIVWDKVVHGLGSDYKYTYELINVCKKGKPEMDTHQGDREYSDVWHIQRAMGKNKDHATAKPIEIVERCLRHSSKPNSLVIDLFLGSGSTLIACQKTNRKCYGMELDPTYVQVILQRWSDFTGEDPVREDGIKFSEVTK